MGNKAVTDGVVFSGRFDPPHPGHIQSIHHLKSRFKYVLVMILDYPERKYPISYVLKVIKDTCNGSSICVQVNKTHFGKLQLHEWHKIGYRYYAGGNLTVLRHMELIIGHENCLYLPRSYEYEAHLYPPP